MVCLWESSSVNGELRHAQDTQPILGALLGSCQEFSPFSFWCLWNGVLWPRAWPMGRPDHGSVLLQGSGNKGCEKLILRFVWFHSSCKRSKAGITFLSTLVCLSWDFIWFLCLIYYTLKKKNLLEKNPNQVKHYFIALIQCMLLLCERSMLWQNEGQD